ncbi:MAG TPA: hypothetical protein VMX55_05270 [candidate division Zixibacteria bacterium]|nr:hypothetical protein [candidate division Zixibacteria bacterium]
MTEDRKSEYFDDEQDFCEEPSEKIEEIEPYPSDEISFTSQNGEINLEAEIIDPIDLEKKKKRKKIILIVVFAVILPILLIAGGLVFFGLLVAGLLDQCINNCGSTCFQNCCNSCSDNCAQSCDNSCNNCCENTCNSACSNACSNCTCQCNNSSSLSFTESLQSIKNLLEWYFVYFFGFFH